MKRSIFSKFLLSYVAVFLVPLIVILVYFYPQSTKILYENALESCGNAVMQYSDNLTQQFEPILYYPHMLQTNSAVSRLALRQQDAFNARLIMDEMRKLFGGNPWVEKVVLYSQETGIFYTETGRFFAEDFNNANSAFRYAHWPYDEMIEDLRSMRSVVFRPQESIETYPEYGYEAITMCLPVPLNNLYPYGVLMIVIQRSQFFYSFENESGDGNIIVLDADNRILAMGNENTVPTDADIAAFLEEYPEEFLGEKTFNNKEYLVGMRNAANGLLRIINIESKSQVLREMQALQMRTLALLLALFAASSVMIYFFMRTNYLPIKQLNSRARDFGLADKDNAFANIEYALDSLKSENDNLIEKVLLNKNITYEYFMMQLLNGNFSNIDVETQAAEHGVTLREKTLVMAFSAPGNILELLAVLRIIAKDSEEVSACLVKGIRHEDFTIVLFFSREEYLRPYYNAIYSLDESIQVGIGSVEQIAHIARSYMLSLSALEIAMARSDANIISYDDIDVNHSSSLKMLMDSLDMLELAVYRKNPQLLRETRNKIDDILHNAITEPNIQKIGFVSTYNLMVRLLRGFGCDLRYLYTMPDRSMKNLPSLDELCDELLRFLAEEQEENAVDINQILCYINENYTNHALSLSMVANAFAMSYSNFSHYFKKQTGHTFSTYLENLRIKHAKKLLMENDGLSVDAIGRMVGYTNGGSFIRAFKKQAHITPGEYRKACKQSK